MTQSSADIIHALTPDGSVQAWNWLEAIEITRQGQTPMPGVDGVEDKWQIACPVRASLARDGATVLDAAGNEIAIAPTIAPVRVDLALILHDPRVVQAIGLIRSVCLDLATGALKPQSLIQETP